ncbi:MAG TPA: SDR family oxidoreductase [Stellaceae bacterium]|nr:SDR family oxidoreductase [Stellaceae bacterium]
MALAGKIAIVTGASRGIGEAIATTLAAHGATVALVARGSADLDAVAARLTIAGGRAFAFPCDLRHAHEVTQVVNTIVTQLGAIDILVNNAGATPHGSLLERDDAEWHDAYEAKIHNFVRMCRACWPYLKARRGQVLNICGVLAQTPNAHALIGSTLAAAVVSLTKALAEFGRPDGIRVNGVSPGLIDTGRFRARLHEIAREQQVSFEQARDQLVQRLGIKRLGTAQEVADVVAFLLSERNTYIDGAIIDVDGGMTKSV